MQQEIDVLVNKRAKKVECNSLVLPGEFCSSLSWWEMIFSFFWGGGGGIQIMEVL